MPSIPPQPAAHGDHPQDVQNPLQMIVRFAQSLLRRKWTIMAWLCFTVSLGVAYFLVTPKQYQSSAELLILHTGEGSETQTQQNQDTLQDYIPTYTKLLSSEEVLKGGLLRLPKEYRTEFIGMTKRAAIEKLRKNISVSATRDTNLVSVSYQAGSPDAAAVIVTEILNSYFAFMQETHQSSSQDVLETLSRKRDRIEQEMLEKQENLLELQASSDTLMGDGDSVKSVVNERVIKLNQTLSQAQKETIEARSFYEAVQDAVHNGEDLQQLMNQSNSPLANEIMKMSIGVDSRDSYAYARLQQQLIEDEAKLREYLNGKYGPNHPQVRQLKERIQSAQKWMQSRGQKAVHDTEELYKDLGPRLLKMAQQRYQHAKSHEDAIERRFTSEKENAAQMNQRLLTLQLAEQDLNRLREDYNVVRDQMNALDLNKQSSLRTRVTKKAEPNPHPVAPKLATSLILGILAGLFFGSVTVVICDLLDDRFHSPDELKRELGAPVMAMIRDLPELPHEHGIESIYTYSKPNSIATEGFRTLRTSIDFAGQSHRKISITSTEPSDGKTTVITNASVAFAQAGKKTLLIDGDMRRPGLSVLFNLRGRHGLSAILRDTRELDDSIRENVVKTAHENLDVIPAGPRPGNPVELLTSQRFEELIAWAETEYDQVLIDAPPALAVTDPAIIGRLVDGVILTVRPDRNKRRMILRAAESVTSLGAELIGVVVNRLSDTSGEYSYGYGYGYGYAHEEEDDDGPVEMPVPRAARPAPKPAASSAPRPRKRFSLDDDETDDRYAA